MPELNKVMGALLRDISHSRVLSDIFSRDISIEYEKDTLLRVFPVPRVEIKEATINLSFAINKVTPKKVDPMEVAGTVIKTSTEKFGVAALDKILEGHTIKGDMLKLIRAKHPRFADVIAKDLEETAKENEEEFRSALNYKYDDYVGKVNEKLSTRLLSDREIKKALLIGLSSTKVSRNITNLANEYAKHVVSGIISAQKEAEKSLSVDVAVTKEELAGLPETIISKLTTVIEIRNYEWIQVSEVENKPIRLLGEK